MNILKVKTKHEMSCLAADIMAAQIIKKPDSVLGLATGETPIEMYDNVAKRNIDFSRVRTVNLDEYVGLDGANENSYRYFMDTNFFSKLNIKKENTNLPCGTATDLDAECARYNALLESIGPRDIQLLGIGLNGHVGFCEPNTEFVPNTSVVSLTESTIKANSRFYDDISLVPKQALTMGIRQIMDAKHILLIANGPAKVEIVEKAFYGKITPAVPASVLQLHPNVTVIVAEN